MEPSPEIASGSSRYECEVFLTKLRRQTVRQVGYAPTSPVWKTEILLLNDWRFKVAAGAATAAASLALQARRTSIYAIQRLKMARATSAALALCSARQAGIDAVRPHAHLVARQGNAPCSIA